MSAAARSPITFWASLASLRGDREPLRALRTRVREELGSERKRRRAAFKQDSGADWHAEQIPVLFKESNLRTDSPSEDFMPKQRKQDLFEDLTGVFAGVPWWIPFLLAGAAWLAVPPIGRAVVDQESWEQVWPLLGGLVATVLVFTGLFGQAEKIKRRRLVAQGTSLDGLRALSWREFEQLCAEAYRRQGYSVSETARGADGGVDLVLQMGRERVFVQCKHYSVRQVDVRRVRELFGVMAAEGATAGIFITSGSYTRDAQRFAEGKKLALVDGPKLLKLLDPVGASNGARGGPRTSHSWHPPRGKPKESWNGILSLANGDESPDSMEREL